MFHVNIVGAARSHQRFLLQALTQAGLLADGVEWVEVLDTADEDGRLVLNVRENSKRSAFERNGFECLPIPVK